MADPHDYANDDTAELIQCLQVGAAVLQATGYTEYPEAMLATAQRMAEMQAKLVEFGIELLPWQEKLIKQIIPDTGRLSERDPSEQTVPKAEGPSTYSQMDFGREDIIGFAIDDKWHPTPGGL